MALTTAQQNRITALKQLVKLRIDEYMETSDVETTVDFNIGDIEYELGRSPQHVLSMIDRSVAFKVARKANYVTLLKTLASKKGIIPLPDDFLRFIRLELSDWTTPVNSLLPDDSRAYRQQQFDMRRGTKESPKSFLVPYHEETYQAETVGTDLIYCVISEELAEGESIELGEEFGSDGGSPVDAIVHDLSDPEFIVLKAVNTGVLPAVGETFAPNDNARAIRLLVKYIDGQSVNRAGFGKAVECYPVTNASTTLNSLVYVPILEAYDIPSELEDALVWYTCASVFGVGERYDGVKFAMAKFEQSIAYINKGMKGDG